MTVRFFLKFRIGIEAEDTETVTHIDDDAVLAGQPFAAVVGIPGLTGLQ